MKWKVLESKSLIETHFFKMKTDKCELPNGKIMPHYYTLEFGDWVNVIPVTPDGRMVLIEQYRHAIGKVTIEIPGGALDFNGRETPEQAALRELREETGYMGEELRFVGKHRPNPATQNNFLHTYIALGCVLDGPQELDPYEDIKVTTRPIPEVIDMIFNGQIEHSLIIASIFKSLRFMGFHIP